jgi:transcriptional regulator with XRE-family HTH domain
VSYLTILFLYILSYLIVAKKIKLSDLEQIGFNIRKIRESKKISRAQIAFELNTTEKQIVRVESGEINSGIITFVSLSRALQVNILDFFVGIKF